MYSQHFHAGNSNIHCAMHNWSGSKTFSMLLAYVWKPRRLWINGPPNRIRLEEEKNVEMGTWHKMQVLIQYPTPICSAVLRFLNPHTGYSIHFPSSSLVLLRSRPIGQMSVLFHHIPRLDDLKRVRTCSCHIKSKPWRDLCSRSSTWNIFLWKENLEDLAIFCVYLFR